MTNSRLRLTALLALILASNAPFVLAADDGSPGSVIASVEAEQEARGLIKPVASATISSEILARIKKLPFRSGERFKSGTLLVEFDCGSYLAGVAVSKAIEERESKRLANLKRLSSLSAASDLEVAIAAADLKKASAEVRLARVDVARCKVVAPYDGAIVEILANEHESVGPQTDVLSILAVGDPEIELIIPSDWLRWIKNGMSFDFLIDETGERLNASLSRIGSTIDPVSQTIKVIGHFQHPPTSGIIAGMSGTAIFNLDALE